MQMLQFQWLTVMMVRYDLLGAAMLQWGGWKSVSTKLGEQYATQNSGAMKLPSFADN